MTSPTDLKPTDRVSILYGRPGTLATLYVGTVLEVETHRVIVQSDGDRGTALAVGLLRQSIRSIEVKPQPPVCVKFVGTGSRCTECRYRRDFH